LDVEAVDVQGSDLVDHTATHAATVDEDCIDSVLMERLDDLGSEFGRRDATQPDGRDAASVPALSNQITDSLAPYLATSTDHQRIMRALRPPLRRRPRPQLR
jgi:hypothetical protein